MNPHAKPASGRNLIDEETESMPHWQSKFQGKDAGDFRLSFIEEIVRKDQQHLSGHRETERRIRQELEDTRLHLYKSSLVHQQQFERKTHIDEEIAELKRYHQSQLDSSQSEWKNILEEQKRIHEEMMKSKEQSLLSRLSESSRIIDVLQSSLREKQSKISELESTIQQQKREYEEQQKHNSRKALEEIGIHEAEWRKKIETCEMEHQRSLQTIQDRMSIEKSALELTMQAKLESKEEQTARNYEKKMKKFERQVIEAENAYTQKAQFLQGSLDELRRENLRLRTVHRSQVEKLEEELHIKDSRLVSMHSSINTVDEITRLSEAWKASTVLLASKVVRACSTVTNIPKVECKNDIYADLFRGFVANRDSEDRTGNGLLDDIVGINKKLITKAFLTSKRLIEKAGKEKLPDTSKI